MLNCRELTRMIASDELVEARWSLRLGGWLHLLMCRDCRRYATQIRTLAAGARRSWGPETEDSAGLDQLERRILERCLGEDGRMASPANVPALPPLRDTDPHPWHGSSEILGTGNRRLSKARSARAQNPGALSR